MTLLNLAQLLRVPHVESGLRFDISPDGQRLTFSWNKTGRWELYERGLNASDSPRPVSEIKGAKFSPRYSPDGSMLPFNCLRASAEYQLVTRRPNASCALRHEGTIRFVPAPD